MIMSLMEVFKTNVHATTTASFITATTELLISERQMNVDGEEKYILRIFGRGKSLKRA